MSAKLTRSDNNNSFFMSWDEFLECCNQFINISNRLNDDWVLCNFNKANDVGVSYLTKKFIKYYGENEELSVNRCENINDCDDTIVSCRESISLEYHILYNPSYGLPSLYFNAWKRDGSIISINKINKLAGDFNCDNKVCIISQQEHPILRRPFYYIHPCDSRNILKSCKSITCSNSNSCRNSLIEKFNINPLVTWLSTIASSVLLDLSLEYANVNFK